MAGADMATLQKNKVLLSPRRTSQQMLQARDKILEQYPGAAIITADDGWKLISGTGTDLSGVHRSHHDCWIEAAL
jgi:hypothetical protein